MFPLILNFIFSSFQNEKSCLIHFNIDCLARQLSNLRLIDGKASDSPFVSLLLMHHHVSCLPCHETTKFLKQHFSLVYFLILPPFISPPTPLWNIFSSFERQKYVRELCIHLKRRAVTCWSSSWFSCKAVAEILFKLKKTNVVIQHPRRYAPNSKHQLAVFGLKKSAAEISLCVVFSFLLHRFELDRNMKGKSGLRTSVSWFLSCTAQIYGPANWKI